MVMMEEHNKLLLLKTRNAEGPSNPQTQQEEDDDLEQDSQVRDIHSSAIASEAELVRCRETLEEKVMELGEKIKENMHLKEKFDTAEREMALLENEIKKCKAQNNILELDVQKLQKQYTSVQSDLDVERQRAVQLAAEKAAAEEAAAEKAAEADDKLLEIKRELHTAVVTAVSAVESKMAEERARIEAEEKALEDEKKQREEQEEELAAKAAVMALSEELQSEMNQWLQELKAKSAYFAPPRIDTACEHFDLMYFLL
jgi:chromosome segregation ATPase